MLAVLAFLTLVQDPQHSPNPALKFFTALRGLPARFKRYLRAVGTFGGGDFSHSLLILAATQLLTPSMGVVRAAQVAGILYVWRNIVQVVTSYPIGVLADRYGTLDDGYFRIVDRLKGQINTADFKVWPREEEEAGLCLGLKATSTTERMPAVPLRP